MGTLQDQIFHCKIQTGKKEVTVILISVKTIGLIDKILSTYSFFIAKLKQVKKEVSLSSV